MTAWALGDAESSQNFRIKIAPIEICFLDQFNLPCPTPFLDFFFAPDRILRVIITFKPDKAIDAVPLGKPTRDLVLVFTDATNEVARYADIQRSLFAAGEKVDVVRHSRISPSFRDGGISAFKRVFDALWRRTRNPETGTVLVSGFRVRAFRRAPE